MTSKDRELLLGGLCGQVERRGSTVVRAGDSRATGHSHQVLRLLEEAGWTGAPRLLDPGPPEVLSYVPGRVPAREEEASWTRTPEALEAVGRLIREFHDLTGASLGEGPHRVICHNDLAPANTVHDPGTGRPIAFIDWDGAAPGGRADDLGHAFWQWMLLGPGVPVRQARDGLSALLRGYDLDIDRSGVVSAAISWQRTASRRAHRPTLTCSPSSVAGSRSSAVSARPGPRNIATNSSRALHGRSSTTDSSSALRTRTMLRPCTATGRCRSPSATAIERSSPSHRLVST